MKEKKLKDIIKLLEDFGYLEENFINKNKDFYNNVILKKLKVVKHKKSKKSFSNEIERFNKACEFCRKELNK